MKVESCPYCGAVAICRDNKKYKRFRVVCLNVEDCDADGPWRKTREDAIRAWNRLALAVQIADAAWLDRELTNVAYSTNYPKLKAALLCSLQENSRLLDQWEEESE